MGFWDQVMGTDEEKEEEDMSSFGLATILLSLHHGMADRYYEIKEAEREQQAHQDYEDVQAGLADWFVFPDPAKVADIRRRGLRPVLYSDYAQQMDQEACERAKQEAQEARERANAEALQRMARAAEETAAAAKRQADAVERRIAEEMRQKAEEERLKAAEIARALEFKERMRICQEQEDAWRIVCDEKKRQRRKLEASRQHLPDKRLSYSLRQEMNSVSAIDQLELSWP